MALAAFLGIAVVSVYAQKVPAQPSVNPPEPVQPLPAGPGIVPPAERPKTPNQQLPPASRPTQNPVPRSSTGLLPVLHVSVAQDPISIDGRLSEPAWEHAVPVVLTQQSPHPGAPTPYLTEVRVLIAGDALILGFTCHDPRPSAIVTHTLTRDGDLTGDDSLSIVLDSFGDKRTGYFFQINSEAARVDGLIAGPGIVSAEWDGIWNARTARTPDGWSAEIWIPAQTLTFAGGGNRWGIELDRFIARDQTELRWASPSLDADLFDLSRAGELELAVPLHQGLGIEFAPYLDGKTFNNFDGDGHRWQAAEGGELTWRITPQLTAVATVNTDFAETEVDSRQINLTPFPLYFPEKRAFFLEGANQYAFGLGLGTVFIPFFSRNVGLLDGYNIPIDGGIKLNGHVGPWSLALLDVETRRATVPDIVQAVLGLPSPVVGGTNLLASRVAYDIDKHLRIGTMFTHGDPEALYSNLMAGADAVWHTSTFLKKRTLQLGGWAATTQGDVPLGKRQAWGIRADYPNDLITCSADINRFGDGFYPLLSFLPRPATNQTDAACSYRPRPSQNGRFRGIRQAAYDFIYYRYTDTGGNLQSQKIYFAPVHLLTNSGDSLTLFADMRHETLTYPFSITSTVTYPVGSYDFQRYGLYLITSQQRRFYFTNQSYIGTYYNGHLYDQLNTLTWTSLHGKAEITATSNNYFGRTPQGNFVEKLWQLKGALSWSPDLSLSTFVQYDNISQGLSSNTRLRWTFRPGDDFFVIWDRTWTHDPARSPINLNPEAESVTAKIRWTFRL